MTEATATDPGTTEAPGSIVPRAVQGDVIDAYESMISAVPDAGQEGIESILRQLAAVTDPAALDTPWQAGGLADFVGRQIIVRGIRKMPSDYPGPLPWFLIIDGQDVTTGAEIHLTTGAVSVVAQLVKAFAESWLPAVFIPRVSDRPTKDGYYPMHLEVVRG